MTLRNGGQGRQPSYCDLHRPNMSAAERRRKLSLVEDKPRARPRVTPEMKRIFYERLDAGYDIKTASFHAGFSYQTGLRIAGDPDMDGHVNVAFESVRAKLPNPRTFEELTPEAQRALSDFGYFQRRFFGRIATPWQEEAAQRVVRLLDTPDEEYLVCNAPPGSGKSTLFTMDLAAWMTCRDRSIRGLIGSRTAKQAAWYVARLRRAFERVVPETAEPKEKAAGRALDAETTLALDFGRFKPVERDVWQSEQFVVTQLDGTAITEKEATWSAFGMDSGFLGGRYDLVIWDDLVDPSKTRTADQVDYQRAWWADVAETRLEPGGLLILQGQRIGAEDLYRHALDMRQPLYDSEEAEDEEAVTDWKPKYHHIKFAAHYPERCQGKATHRLSSPPYPDGCLLYPRRLGWKKIAGIMENRPDRFRVLYQQEDVDPDEVLVNPDWVYGRNGHIGCVDRDRDRLELPPGAQMMTSVVSCDPSATNYWAIEWWLYNELADFRYLIDLHRGRMDAPDFLDYSLTENRYTGMMEQWQQMSIRLGIPISHWVVEINAAQRFLLQYDFVHKWMQRYGVSIIPHSTQRNKTDSEFGVQMLAPLYREGKIRLPGKDAGMVGAVKLIDEVTRYTGDPATGTRTDDCIMAQWFFEFQLPHIKGRFSRPKKAWRPTWFNGQPREDVNPWGTRRVVPANA